MSAAWLKTLLRARQAQEDAARQRLVAARQLEGSSRTTLRRHRDRLDRMSAEVVGEHNASAFVAAAAALQSAAAAHSAAAFTTAQAELAVSTRQGELTRAGVARGAAERLTENADAEERLATARVVQADLDEVAARIRRTLDEAGVEMRRWRATS